MNPVMVVSADWHIEEITWKKKRDLTGDAIFSLSQIISRQLALGVPHLALGDLYEDPEPTPKDVRQVVDLMDKLQEARLPLYFVQGQHEWVRECPDVPWMNLSRWPIHIHRKLIRIGSFNVYGLDYLPIGKCQEEFTTIPHGADILATHQVWRDWIPLGGAATATFGEVPHVRYIMTGDYHRHLLLGTKGSSGQTITVVSPGSICMKKLDEADRKFFFVLYDDGSIRSEPLRTRPVYRYQARSEDDLQFLLDEAIPTIQLDMSLPDEIRKPIIDVEYDDALSNAYARLVARIDDKCHAFIRPMPNLVQQVEIDADLRQTKVVTGMEGCLETFVSRGDPVYDAVVRLLQSPNPYEELQEMYEEVLNGTKPAGATSSDTPAVRIYAQPGEPDKTVARKGGQSRPR